MDDRMNGWILSQGYWIMANVVLFDNRLTDKQKLLYCLISSLCAEKWYCWASNKYLWEKLWVKEWTISNWVKTLIEYGYIESDINKSKGNERHITIANVIIHNTYCEKSQEGYCDISQDNIISDNITKENSLLNKEQQSWNVSENNLLPLNNNCVLVEEKEKNSAKKEKEITVAINWLISDIKGICNDYGIAYDKKMDRKFAKHILTAKEYWEFCDKIWQWRIEFAENVLIASIKINYWKWPLAWTMKIYQNYADLYNQAKNKIQKTITPTINVL